MNVVRRNVGSSDAETEDEGAGALSVMMLELDSAQIAVAGLCGGAYLLCACAELTVNAGMLKVSGCGTGLW